MRNLFGKLMIGVILTTLLLTGVVIYFQYGNSKVGNFPIEINKNRPIGLVFVGGLNMDEKRNVLKRVGLTTPAENLYPTVEFEVGSADHETSVTKTINSLKHEQNVTKVEQTVGNMGLKLLKLTLDRDTSKDEALKIVDKHDGELYFFNNKDSINVLVPKGKEQYYVDRLLQDTQIEDALVGSWIEAL